MIPIRSKRAQTEIMGLAIIMILVVIGFMLFLKFGTAEKSDLKQDFVDTKLASNLLNVILKTTLEEQNIELKNIYQACAEGDTSIKYGGMNSCEKVNEVVNIILDKTLKTWKKSYTYTASKKNGPTYTIIKNGNCNRGLGSGTSSLQSETFLIPFDDAHGVGTMLITLDICR